MYIFVISLFFDIKAIVELVQYLFIMGVVFNRKMVNVLEVTPGYLQIYHLSFRILVFYFYCPKREIIIITNK